MSEGRGKREAERGGAGFRRAAGGKRRAISPAARRHHSALHTPHSAFHTLFPLLALTLLLAACDNSFNPVDDARTDHFAVFGYLDTETDTQFVRISPLRATLAPGDDAATVQVSSTLLSTGAEAAWRDSLVRLDDGETGLLFYAPLRVQPGDTYRLAVRGDDDAVTEALTRVPPPATHTIAPAQVIFSGNVTQQVALLDLVQPPQRMTLLYWVRAPDTGDAVSVQLPLSSTSFLNRGRLDVTVNLSTDRNEIYRRLRVPLSDSTVVLDSLGLEVEQLSPEWLTPNASPNIRNGFGFFGAVSQYTLTWTLDSLSTRRIGFVPP